MSAVPSVDPETAPEFDAYAEAYYELRKAKGMTPDEARRIMKDPIFFGTMMVHKGHADGLVSGARHSTADTIRPALQFIKTKPGISIVSSSFVMIVPNCEYGDQGMFIFADCAVMPNPTDKELAEIAIASAETGRVLCGMDPRVAMLSFSTCGSAKHELVDKVKRAVAIAQRYGARSQDRRRASRPTRRSSRRSENPRRPAVLSRARRTCLFFRISRPGTSPISLSSGWPGLRPSARFFKA